MTLRELVVEHCGEASELLEEVERLQQNMDLYKTIVKDPVSHVEALAAEAVDEDQD